ncbi:hypothetical protein [Brevundimonas sp. NIBR10]|uniref:hypothetical protein n=1 Tax=Brevundimonas sp. NIBR10 TaxID=3015997 RepID=UPI0022F1A747|nr:hypothetical protein [Brevundimonas sp. NIBR10]
MSLVQIAIGVVVVIYLWSRAFKGPGGSPQFSDQDNNGAPDASAHDKQAVTEMDRAEQARRHPDGQGRRAVPGLLDPIWFRSISRRLVSCGLLAHSRSGGSRLPV